jgi:hypothetical protein
MDEVPDDVGPLPVAVMAMTSVPLYPGFAVYWKVDAFSRFNVPCAGFCEMLEFLTSPSSLIGNRQVPPDAISKEIVELTPQPDSEPDAGHSEAACAGEKDANVGAPTNTANVRSVNDFI